MFSKRDIDELEADLESRMITAFSERWAPKDERELHQFYSELVNLMMRFSTRHAEKMTKTYVDSLSKIASANPIIPTKLEK